MTQGEILSALAPIDTMISICKVYYGRPLLVGNDVNTIMPFVYKAQKAAEKISRYALDHFNSQDEGKRGLSEMICNRFNSMFIDLSDIKFNGYKDDVSIDWLNNNIKSVADLLFNTTVAVDTLPERPVASPNDNALQAARIAELEAKVQELEAQLANRLEGVSQEEFREIFDGAESLQTGGKLENKELEKAQKRIIELEAKVEELQQKQKASELQGIKGDEWVVELFSHLCYEDEQIAREILNEIRGKDDPEIADIIIERIQRNHISPKAQNREIWRILHAAKLYRGIEGNLNTALRRRKKRQ